MAAQRAEVVGLSLKIIGDRRSRPLAAGAVAGRGEAVASTTSSWTVRRTVVVDGRIGMEDLICKSVRTPAGWNMCVSKAGLAGPASESIRWAWSGGVCS
mmetsp:Transcript_111411/g.355527  ORF Transcript_111411/g.355527 Transcript_111411/m.355527 type:complete len:99 (-) Transcript_111411:7-303(-)